ncbi:MAG: peptidylprolyl isomerase [Verrucomicrobiota bacterium]
MKRVLILGLFVAAVAISCSSKNPSNSNFVVAEGKGIKITRGELNKERDEQIEVLNVSKEPIPVEQLAAIDLPILKQMIDKRLMLNAAMKIPNLNLDQEVENTFDGMKKKFPSEKEFEEQIRKASLTPEKIKKEIRYQVALEKVTEAQSKSEELTVSDEEVKKFYDSNAKLWDRPETARAQHILIFVPEGTSDVDKAAKKKILEAARQRIVKGEAFEKVAAEVSEDKETNTKGGMLPPFGRQSRVAEDFVNAVFKLKVGQLSSVFATKYGYHVVKLLELIPPKTFSFDEAKEDIKAQFTRNKKFRAMQTIVKKIRDEAQVKINLPQPPPAPSMPEPPVTPQPQASPAPAEPAPASK